MRAGWLPVHRYAYILLATARNQQGTQRQSEEGKADFCDSKQPECRSWLFLNSHLVDTTTDNRVQPDNCVVNTASTLFGKLREKILVWSTWNSGEVHHI